MYLEKLDYFVCLFFFYKNHHGGSSFLEEVSGKSLRGRHCAAAWLGWLFIVVFKPCKLAKIVYGPYRICTVIGRGSFVSLIKAKNGKKCTTKIVI
jgi:hypothetical protein